MAVAIRGSDSSGNLNGADLTLNFPGGTAQNDVAYVFHGFGERGGDATMAMTTSGYTGIADLWGAATGAGEGANAGLFRKVQGATPDTTAVTDGGGNTFNAVGAGLFVFSGADTTTPEDVTSTTDTGNDPSTASGPSITPTNNNCMILVCGGWGHHQNGTDKYTAPTSYTNGVDFGANDSDDFNGSMDTRLLSGGGGSAEDPGVWGNFSADDSGDGWVSVTVAIRESGAGGGGGRIMSSLVGGGGLAYLGGIAGAQGGLAG